MAELTREQKWLKYFAADWSFENSAVRPSDGAPCTCTGQGKMQLFGNSIVGELRGTFNDGNHMLGQLTLAYDIFRKKLVSTYLCGDAGFVWKYDGQLDDAGKKAIFEADGPDFFGQSGPESVARYRGVFEINGPESWTHAGFIRTPAGEWKQVVKAEYRRRDAR